MGKNFETRLDRLEKIRGIAGLGGGSCKCGHELRSKDADWLGFPPVGDFDPPTICPKCGKPKDRIIIQGVESDIPDPRNAIPFS